MDNGAGGDRRSRGNLARIGGILVREDWIYLLSLLAPLVVYNIGLKVLRVATQVSPPGPLGFVDQLRSDVLFNVGFVALWVGLFAVFRSGMVRGVLLPVFHISCILMLILTTSSHFYYETTGSPLDYTMIAVTIETFSEVRGVIASEMTSLHWLLISFVLFYGIAGPAVVTRLTGRDWHIPLRTSRAASVGSIAAVCLVSVLFVSLSALPNLTGASNNFSRDAIVNIVMSEVASPQIDQTQIASRVAAEKMPTDASLVPTDRTDKKNVVMVFLESERAKSTTPYNPDLDTTPFLDQLSKESLVAKDAYAVVPHTSKSMTAANCGVEPPLDTVMTESEPDAIPAQCIADLLGDQGYKSVFFQSATENFERRRALVGNFGYDEFYPLESLPKEGFEEVNYFGYEDDVMLGPSRQWLEQNDDSPFLATYLTVTTHHDYNVPDDFPKKKYSDDPLLNDYQNTVAYQDRFLENLFQQYKDLGLYDDTIFVVMADHGEGFGEHGLMQHDNTIYNEGIKIPLMIHDPERFQDGEEVTKPVQNIAVLQTVADLLGYDIKNDYYRGYSLLRPETIPDKLRVSCWTENRCMAMIEGQDKYIYHFSNKSEEAFDLAEDPDEKESVIDGLPDGEVDAKRYDLLEWQATVGALYDRQATSTRESTTPEG